MVASQSIIHTRRRTRRADPLLSRFVDSGSDNRVATRSATKRLAAARANQPSPASDQDELRTDRHSETLTVEPPTIGDLARNDLAALDSITSALESSSLSNDDQSGTLPLPSQHIDSTPLAGPTTVEALAARRRHKVTTYKQRRSLLPAPPESDNRISLRSRQVTRSISTPTSTPSCSPVPTHTVSKSRKRRRRQIPLQHRLARAARSRLPKASQDILSQPPIAVLPEPTEEDVPPITSEEASSFTPEHEPVAVPESNVVQRHLTTPQNYTIPDIKDLLSAKHQPFPTISNDDEPDAELQRNSLPQFVVPPNNNLHSPKPRVDPKRGRPGRRDLPRLSFVPLEAHQEQATARPADNRPNQVVRVQRILPVTQAPSPSVRSDIHVFDTPPPKPPAARVNFVTPGRSRSPSRVFVKGTPEPGDPLPRIYPNIADGPSFLRASKSSPIRPMHAPGDPSSTASGPVEPSARPYAPMTDLLDDLTKLAKSAAQMNAKSSKNTPNRIAPKRTYQASLANGGYISHMVPEAGTPTKTRRLN